MSLLSPGVEIVEIDASMIVPTVSNSVACFSGDFERGPVESYLMISNEDELVSYYGKPNKTNYNDWMQCSSFLQYGDQLLISRAANYDGSTEIISGLTVTLDTTGTVIPMTGIEDGTTPGIDANISVGDFIAFGDATGPVIERFLVTAVDMAGGNVTIDRTATIVVADDNKVYTIAMTDNAVFEASKVNNVAPIATVTVTSDVTADTLIPITGTITDLSVGDTIEFGDVSGPVYTDYKIVSIDTGASTITIDNPVTVVVADNDSIYSNVSVADVDYIEKQMPILNYSDFELKETSIAFTSTDSKLKFIARNPGAWGNDIEIAIAKPSDFGANKYIFDGIALDDLFEYFPTGMEVGLVVRYDDVVKETYTVSFDPTEVNESNKSIYIEDVIDKKSNYIFVKENTAAIDEVDSYIFSSPRGVINLVNGLDSPIGINDIARGYEIWDNKEEIDVDVVIANELDNGVAAKDLVDTRKDCIAFIGANREDLVGLKSAEILQNLIAWRTTGAANFNDMFVVATGNYLYMYNKYLDAHKWVNCAGSVAGLRCQTNHNRNSWWASAGLERGILNGISKLAFNPNVSARDQMYKRGINPIVSFAGQGILMWGQKTLLDKPSSFDRVNVRSLFNTMERSLGKMAKYEVMEFNDSYTRNRIISMIKPYLSNVKAGRGIQDFLVICDETNNTPAVIQRNELVVDIYIRPTFVAEFIKLRFTNAGTNSFSEIIA